MTRQTMHRSTADRSRTMNPPLGVLRDELDTILDRFVRSPLGLPIDVSSGSTAWPSLDISETPEAVLIRAEVPGIPAEDVDVSVENGALVISGTVAEERTTEGEQFHHVERRRGEFRRVIHLPDTVDVDRIEAEANDGILTVRIPTRADAGRRRIDVRSNSRSSD